VSQGDIHGISWGYVQLSTLSSVSMNQSDASPKKREISEANRIQPKPCQMIESQLSLANQNKNNIIQPLFSMIG